MFGKARFAAVVLLVIGSLSQITPSANAAGNKPVDFRSLSVCSESYETKQIAICVPKGENFVAQLSESNLPMSGVVGTPITLTTSGGSGTGAVTFSTSTTGCSVTSGTLTASIATTCLVFASKAIDNDFWSITSNGAQFDFRGVQTPLTLNNSSTTGPTGSSVILSTSGGTGAGAVTYALSAQF
jgi:hypothetical protein